MSERGPERPIDYSGVAAQDGPEAIAAEAAAVDDLGTEGGVLRDPSHEQDAQLPGD